MENWVTGRHELGKYLVGVTRRDLKMLKIDTPTIKLLFPHPGEHARTHTRTNSLAITLVCHSAADVQGLLTTAKVFIDEKAAQSPLRKEMGCVVYERSRPYPHIGR